MASPKEPNPNEFFPPWHRKGLFQSQAWNNAWLKHWGSHPDLQPLTATNPSNAEFFRYRQWKKGLIPISTAIPVGTTSPAARSIRCEYLSIAKDAEKPAPDIEGYLDRALQHSWDQLVLPDVLEGTAEYHAIIKAAKARGLYVIEQERETAYAVDLRHGSFESYLANLGKNSRLRLFNRRKKLNDLGTVEINNLWPDRDGFFELLNDFHQKRWGKPCYQGRNQAFMHDLLVGLEESGQMVNLSVLSVSGQPLSCALDITAQRRCYNLQAGYREDAIKGVSLGTLHLGYQIEKAFKTNAEVYDFMAGSGKNSQYKSALSTMSAEFVSLMVVRNSPLKLAYRLRAKRKPRI